jgi:hypothetical protein
MIFAATMCLHMDIMCQAECALTLYSVSWPYQCHGLGVHRVKKSGGNQEVDAMRDALTALESLQPAEQRRTLNWLAEKLGVGAVAASAAGANMQDAPGGGGPGAPPVTGQTPKTFMTAKKPKTVQERIACLAYYLTHNRNVAKFKTKDLTSLNSDAAQPKISNPAFFVRNAANAQFLALAGGGSKQITARGEALVVALPDREAVKKALEDHPVSGKKGKGGRKKKAVK